MAFKITQKPTFTSRVKVETPNDKGGHDRSEFQAKFARVGMEQVDELRNLSPKEVMEKVLTDWSDLIDDDNNPVPYNTDTLRALLDIPQALAALSESFWGSLFKAKEKN